VALAICRCSLSELCRLAMRRRAYSASGAEGAPREPRLDEAGA
jgi:hypothetical protein